MCRPRRTNSAPWGVGVEPLPQALGVGRGPRPVCTLGDGKGARVARGAARLWDGHEARG